MTADSIEVRLLGPVRAWRDNQKIALGSAHRRAILAILAIRSNHAVSKAELIDGVWGEAPPASAVASLYTYISGLRGVLEPQRSKRSGAMVLTSAGAGYSLLLGSDALDVHLFEQCRDRAERLVAGDPAAALAELDAAVALWRGTAFSGIDGPFAEAQRSRLDELRLGTLQRRAELRLALGGHTDVVAELRGLVCEHPLREGLRAVLIKALCLSGRSAEALEVFRDIRRMLVEELGTEPGLPLQRLHQRVLANDPALIAPPILRRVLVTSSRQERSLLPTAVREVPSTLIGRDNELACLRRAVTNVANGRGGYLWLEGEHGVGKSAIVAAGLAAAAAEGCRIAHASCGEMGQQFPFHVLLECLDVDRSSRDPRRATLANALRNEGSTASGRAFDGAVLAAVERFAALVGELCAEAPLVLVVEDLQWIDEASTLVWHRLTALAREMPLLLIGASRLVARRAELDRLRRAVHGSCGEVVTIDPLQDSAVDAMVTAIVGAPPGPRLRRTAARAGGNPLYIKETVDALLRDRAVHIGDGVAEVDEAAVAGIPQLLGSALTGRLCFLSPPTTEALRRAALLGDEFALGDLATVLGCSASTLVPAVEEAMTTGILAATGAVLVFRHPLIRQALYDGMPAPVRAALHLEAAQALAIACAPIDRVVEQLAATPSATASWMVTWLVDNAQSVELSAPEAALRLMQDVFDHPSVTEEHRELLAAALARLHLVLDLRSDVHAKYVLARTRDSARAAEMRRVLAELRRREGSSPVAADPLRYMAVHSIACGDERESAA